MCVVVVVVVVVRQFCFAHSQLEHCNDFYDITPLAIRNLICSFFCLRHLCPSIFQLTATGVAGLHGLTVTSHVTVETRQESASVIILNQLLAGETAKVRKLKLSLVIWTAVQVCIWSMRLNMILCEGLGLGCMNALSHMCNKPSFYTLLRVTFKPPHKIVPT